MSRRRFIKSSASTAGVVAGARIATALTAAQSCVSERPPLAGLFPHGVASGDPQADSIILWTRINTNAAEAVEVRYELSESPTFNALVAEGNATTSSEQDYCVKARVGGLGPNATYYYRFVFMGTHSAIGRTKTAGDRASLRLAVVTCSNLETGYFHAYRRIAERNDLDAVVHLGDYFYEYPNFGYNGIGLRLAEPAHETISLADYRQRLSSYRMDPDLQEVHRQHPMIAVWDDHESANDSYRDGAQNHDALEGAWSTRKAAAIRAYREWMPCDVQDSGRIHRTIRYGNFASIIMLDTRLWGREQQATSTQDSIVGQESRQLLGADQETFLRTEVGQSGNWALVCSQVAMTQLTRIHDDADKWDGYPAQRRRVLEMFRDQGAGKVVVLSGDMHWALASDLALDPEAAAYDPISGNGAVATEFMTPPLSSPNIGPSDLTSRAAATRHIKYADNANNGYLMLDITPNDVQAQFYYIGSVRSRELHQERLAALFSVTHGRATVARATGAPRPGQPTPALAPGD